MTERVASPPDRTGGSRSKRAPADPRPGEPNGPPPSEELSEILADSDQGTPRPVSPDRTTESAAAGLASGPLWEEEFLRELDQIQGDLASQAPKSAPPAAPGVARTQPDWREDVLPGAEGAGRWGAPSPYLGERLDLARGAASRLTNAARTLEGSVSSLREDLETIDRELARAREELDFQLADSSSESPGPPVDLPPAPPPVAPISRPGAGAGRGAKPASQPPRGDPRKSLTGSFPDFTVSRYNQTVSALHARQRSIGWGTVVAAVGISALLLVLTLRADEPLPAMWLALLPLVWMVPVPFFLAAFRGTHRVLRQNRMELPEER